MLNEFCVDNDYAFPPDNSAIIAEFICSLADGVKRPKSYLGSATAAITMMYKGLGRTNPMNSPEICNLQTALIKAGTTQARNNSKAMPIAPFRELFCSWPENNELDVKRLRVKAIALLALTLMLRPSDIAPKAELYDPESDSARRLTFAMKHVIFNEDGSAQITFFGIKNDMQRTGFEGRLPSHSEAKLDPVRTLHDYIHATMPQRPQPENPVFISLRAPFHAIDSSTVAKVLNSAISQAGLDNKGFSAKSFRCTGATAAIEEGCDPEIVMKLGRWKTRDIFYEHYVHAKTPEDFSNNIIDHN